MLGNIIKPLYGPTKYGELLTVVCFISNVALILLRHLIGVYGVKNGRIGRRVPSTTPTKLPPSPTQA
ncbi:hypothetical protein ANAPC2_00356 [Anaplasma phagocytophilum]|nr:hypothetical protein ANAPC2_00356 [Anaplasma phagocytophilum]